MNTSDWQVRVDDLSGDETRALVAAHLADMLAQSPAESVHALAVESLRDPAITLYSIRRGAELGGIGALKRLDQTRGELKTMRTTEAARGQGLGRRLLVHILDEARAAGLTTVLLETGSSDAFIPARALYASEGFLLCDAFDAYEEDPESMFMRLAL